jgi:hypothetical protein
LCNAVQQSLPPLQWTTTFKQLPLDKRAFSAFAVYLTICHHTSAAEEAISTQRLLFEDAAEFFQV